MAERVIPARRVAARERAREEASRETLVREVRALTSGRVAAGPFRDLALSPALSWAHSSMGAYLIGSYERELHPWLERAIATRPETVIDVGSAEGYYAVGLALRLPAAAVHAFDVDPAAQDLCRVNAELNGVAGKLHVNGLCDHRRLRELAGAGHLLIVDCEGGEDTLLDPWIVPELERCWMLVELHEFLDAGIGPRLQKRFQATHRIEMVTARDTRLDPQPELFASMSRRDFDLIVDEQRPREPMAMRWALLTPRDAQHSDGGDSAL